MSQPTPKCGFIIQIIAMFVATLFNASNIVLRTTDLFQLSGIKKYWLAVPALEITFF